MGEKTTNKMHRVWAFIVSVIVTIAAIIAILVIAVVGKKGAVTSEPDTINAPTAISQTPSISPVSEPIDDPYPTNNSSSSNSASSQTSTANSSASAISSKDPIPETGPSDIIGLALLAGSIAMYIASVIMVKKDQLKQ